MAITPGAIVNPGDVYWVSLNPTVGSEQSGRRPCIVISRSVVNNSGRTVVVVPMSTKTQKANSYRVLLPATEIVKDVSSASAIQDSVALCDHIREIDKTRLEQRIGKLSQNAVYAVQLGLAFLFDIR